MLNEGPACQTRYLCNALGSGLEYIARSELPVGLKTISPACDTSRQDSGTLRGCFWAEAPVLASVYQYIYVFSALHEISWIENSRKP